MSLSPGVFISISLTGHRNTAVVSLSSVTLNRVCTESSLITCKSSGFLLVGQIHGRRLQRLHNTETLLFQGCLEIIYRTKHTRFFRVFLELAWPNKPHFIYKNVRSVSTRPFRTSLLVPSTCPLNRTPNNLLFGSGSDTARSYRHPLYVLGFADILLPHLCILAGEDGALEDDVGLQVLVEVPALCEHLDEHNRR
jgi:hypothetical protein